MSKGKRNTSVVAMMAVLASLMLPILATTPASATPPDHVSNTLQGCKPNPASSYVVSVGPPVSAICTVAGNYTTGNLGKSWDELDLVPFRLTESAGNAAPANQTYSGAIVLDAVDGTPDRPGYDVISAPVLNVALSDTANGNCAITVGPQLTTTGFGGIEQSIYRILTITQAKNTTCVYDYFGRLAVGSHLFPGSSLHANVANETLTQGGSDVSIPVNQISPQDINKTMTGVQNSDVIWSIDKSPNPTSFDFGNVCDTDNVVTSLPVEVTVTWEKEDAVQGGDITIHTLVEATNPASRVITVQVTDQLRSGTTVLQTHVGIPVDLAANTQNINVLEYTTTIPGDTPESTINDIATATYTDKLTGVPVPGKAFAVFPPFNGSPPVQDAFVVGDGITTNDAANISDSETITGAGLSFTLDSVTGDADAIDGDSITGSSPGPVDWTSGEVTAGGEVVLHKTVTFDPSVGATSGSLDDTATVTGVDGFSTSADASTTLESSLAGSLVINKTTSVPVDGETIFEFEVNPGAIPVTVTIPDGGNTGTSDALTGLTAGDYTVTETNANGFTPAADQNFTIGAGACDAELDFENTFGPATATALKITNPLGAEAGWEFTVTLDGNPFDTGTSDALGVVQWDTAASDTLTLADEGTYTITETTQQGWVLDPITVNDNGNGSGTTDATSCSFTVDFPADADGVFDCSFTNTQNGSIEIRKVTDPSPDPLDSSFEFTRDFGTSPVLLKDGGSDFVGDLAPGTYSVAETDPAPNYSLTDFSCDDGSDPASIDLAAGENVICTATNTLQSGNIVVQKVTDPASDTTTEFEFDTSYGDNFKLVGGGSNDSGALTPGGGYSVDEINIPAGWTLKSFVCDGTGNTPASITVVANETVTCIATNEQAGTISVKKTFNGGSDPTKSFTFELRQGVDINDPLNPLDDNPGTLKDTQTVTANNTAVQLNGNLAPGIYQVCEVVPGPGWTFNLGGGEYTLVIAGVNDRICVDVDLSAGENAVVTADNTPPPGGGQLTIGFWKNHASCKTSGGNQAPVLDQVLATFPIEAGQTKPGFYVGTLYVDTCAEARNLLDKKPAGTVGKGKKAANDALINLAAQYVAAKLNIQGGAGTCPAITTAMAQAAALFSATGFDGSAATALTPAQKAQANSLATTIDQYNNGLLC